MSSVRKKTEKLALSAMLISVMMILSYIESLFPIAVSVPGIKLGLANSVLLFSLFYLGIPSSTILMLAKVFLSGYLFGNPNIMLYSLAGGITSLLGMILFIYGISKMSPITAGMVGAVLHNVGQVGVAMLQLQTFGLLYYMAVLMLFGLVMGGITGLACQMLMTRVKTFAVQKGVKSSLPKGARLAK